MFLEIHAETIVTHECRRTGQQIEDQRYATTYRVELAQLAGLLKPRGGTDRHTTGEDSRPERQRIPSGDRAGLTR